MGNIPSIYAGDFEALQLLGVSATVVRPEMPGSTTPGIAVEGEAAIGIASDGVPTSNAPTCGTSGNREAGGAVDTQGRSSDGAPGGGDGVEGGGDGIPPPRGQKHGKKRASGPDPDKSKKKVTTRWGDEETNCIIDVHEKDKDAINMDDITDPGAETEMMVDDGEQIQRANNNIEADEEAEDANEEAEDADEEAEDARQRRPKLVHMPQILCAIRFWAEVHNRSERCVRQEEEGCAECPGADNAGVVRGDVRSYCGTGADKGHHVVLRDIRFSRRFLAVDYDTWSDRMSTEESVGITCYANALPGFKAILKHRYSDFLVNEIDPDGVVVHLSSLDSKTAHKASDVTTMAKMDEGGGDAPPVRMKMDGGGSGDLAGLDKHVQAGQACATEGNREGKDEEEAALTKGDTALAEEETGKGVVDKVLNLKVKAIDGMEIDIDQQLSDLSLILANEEDMRCIQKLIEKVLEGSTSDMEPSLLKPDPDKERRTRIHKFFKEKLPFLVTDTVDIDHSQPTRPKTIRVRYRSGIGSSRRRTSNQSNDETGEKKRQRGDVAGNTSSKPAKKVRRDDFDTRGCDDWPPNRGKFLRFHLYKENKDLQEALYVVGQMLRVQGKSFGFSGTKDKRGVTVQRVTVFKQTAERLAALNARLRGIRLGDFAYVDKGLRLGMLSGNQFRFGSLNIATYLIGAALLRGEWKAAADLLLKPREGESPEVSRVRHKYAQDGDIEAALSQMPSNMVAERALLLGLKKSPNNFLEAIKCIPRTMRTMYVHSYQSFLWNHAASHRINRYGASDVVVGDLVYERSGESRPLKLPLTGITAVHGEEESQAAGVSALADEAPDSAMTEQETGMPAVARGHLRESQIAPHHPAGFGGDTSEQPSSVSNGSHLMGDEQKEALTAEKMSGGKGEAAADKKGEVVTGVSENCADKDSVEGIDEGLAADAVDEASLDFMKSSQNLRVKHVTEEDTIRRLYTIEDVLLPLPGASTLLPAHETADIYTEMSKKDGINLTSSSHKVKDFSIMHLAGGYRKLIQKPQEFSWEILKYEDMNDTLAETDLDRIAKAGGEREEAGLTTTEAKEGQVQNLSQVKNSPSGVEGSRERSPQLQDPVTAASERKMVSSKGTASVRHEPGAVETAVSSLSTRLDLSEEPGEDTAGKTSRALCDDEGDRKGEGSGNDNKKESNLVDDLQSDVKMGEAVDGNRENGGEQESLLQHPAQVAQADGEPEQRNDDKPDRMIGCRAVGDGAGERNEDGEGGNGAPQGDGGDGVVPQRQDGAEEMGDQPGGQAEAKPGGSTAGEEGNEEIAHKEAEQLKKGGEVGKPRYTALTLRMKLPTSAYATMMIRELIKGSTSADYHKKTYGTERTVWQRGERGRGFSGGGGRGGARGGRTPFVDQKTHDSQGGESGRGRGGRFHGGRFRGGGRRAFRGRS
ncbi:hypothetical protein CBR_g36821 [Chara braunii]|uniref:TRUD domain-containing protein n=1 Tax=Chara braunii TaxID=69332 RepID=A0A388LLN5_CHABU|nr:hypothetical protein CBR_g36821 [Chara braunii]|eukprot:GBG83207.1 hypothetical protein CBR_g36821 [Chara braunii]